jgi:phosphoglycolate phosphatase-like HAD superfamily hydrolase
VPAVIVLFDIDGTLVRKAGPHHRLALEQATEAVTGIPVSMDSIDTHGRLDHQLIEEMLRLQGAQPQPGQLPAIFQHASDLYDRTCPDIRDRVCPGVPELLEALASRGARLGLVTGNLARIGWRKVEQAGLRHYFQFGAFSGMASTRTELVALALSQAPHAGATTSLIGDHYNDIEAAKSNGIRAIGVATGQLTTEQLRASGADLAFETLHQLTWDHLCAPAS